MRKCTYSLHVSTPKDVKGFTLNFADHIADENHQF
jgi:hypothetical protein